MVETSDNMKAVSMAAMWAILSALLTDMKLVYL
jgi:hypothetical protein